MSYPTNAEPRQQTGLEQLDFINQLIAQIYTVGMISTKKGSEGDTDFDMVPK